MKYLVYGLIDPRTRLIRYVGKSSSGYKRPREHATATKKTYCHSWILQLKNLGLTYEITILEVCDSAQLIDKERWWIAFGKACGWPLTNMTDGGEGIPLGYKVPEHIRLARKGRVTSIETRLKLSRIMKGRKASPEARVNMSRAQKGRIVTPETKLKLSTIFKGKGPSKEQLDALHAGNVGRKHSDLTHQRMSEAALRREQRRRQLKETV